MPTLTEEQASKTLGPKGECPHCGSEGKLEDVFENRVFWCKICGTCLNEDNEYFVPEDATFQ